MAKDDEEIHTVEYYSQKNLTGEEQCKLFQTSIPS